MTKMNKFIIRNDAEKPVILNVEPEGAFYHLDVGDEVSVTDLYDAYPVNLRISFSAAGEPIVSIWPGDGKVRVEKDGNDLLDLV
jgi:hypothetical protein